jgi:DNA-binding response OmpR family regulator
METRGHFTYSHFCDLIARIDKQRSHPMVLPYVLLVEDDTIIREIMVSLLNDDFQIVSAKDGASALAVLDTDPVLDLLIGDVHLPPGAQGLALAKRAAELGIPALLISGDGLRAEELEAAGYDVLQKPFHIRELVERAKLAISHAPARGSTA